MDFTQHIMISAVVIFTVLVGMITYLVTRIVKLQKDKDETISNLVNMYSDIRYKVDRIFNINKDVLVPACNNGDVVYEEMSKKLLDISDDAKLIRAILNAQSGVMIENRKMDEEMKDQLKELGVVLKLLAMKAIAEKENIQTLYDLMRDVAELQIRIGEVILIDPNKKSPPDDLFAEGKDEVNKDKVSDDDHGTFEVDLDDSPGENEKRVHDSIDF